jgi:hypothetical protein
LIVVPLDAAGVNVHPVAVPEVLAKSLDVSPLMASLKVKVYVAGNDMMGLNGDVIVTVGAVLSITNVDVVDDADTFPAASVKVTDNVQEPSVRPTSSHEPDELATAPLHVTVVPPETADTDTEPVASGVDTVAVTELFFVFASLLFNPVSEAAAIAGAFGADGAVRSIVSVPPVNATVGPAFDARSATAEIGIRGMTVPCAHEFTVTVNTVPEEASGLNEHEFAVPAFEKSADVSPVIASLKVSVKVDDDALVGVESGVNDDTAGAVTSRVTVVADTAVAGPVLLIESFTMPVFNVRITVPAEQLVNETVTEVPLDELGVPTTQPVAVPVT